MLDEIVQAQIRPLNEQSDQDLHYLSLTLIWHTSPRGVQWLSGRVLELGLRSHWFEPHWRHCIVFCLKMVQLRKHPDMTEKLLTGMLINTPHLIVKWTCFDSCTLGKDI